MSAQPGQPPVAPPNGNARQASLDQIVQQILGGEIPGTGYLNVDATEERRGPAPTADQVRDEVLRAVQVCAKSAQLPFGQVSKPDAAKAALAFAQTYLLLDPSVDENGIPVEGEGSVAFAHAKAAHQFPPHVGPGPAAEKVAQKNEGKSKALQGTRPSRPRPKPRPGS